MASIFNYPRSVAVTLIDGGAAATPLGRPSHTGLNTGDQIVAVHQVSADGSLTVNADLTAEASIVGPGQIQLTTTVTTGDKLIVVFQQVNV